MNSRITDIIQNSGKKKSTVFYRHLIYNTNNKIIFGLFKGKT